MERLVLGKVCLMLCPHCGQSNTAEALVCKHCGRSLTAPVSGVSPAPASAEAEAPAFSAGSAGVTGESPAETVPSVSAAATGWGLPIPDFGTQSPPPWPDNMPSAAAPPAYAASPGVPLPPSPTGPGPAPGAAMPPLYRTPTLPPMSPGGVSGYGMVMAYGTQCRVCGTMVPPGHYKCPRCGTPVGMIANPNDATSATYVPIYAAGSPSPVRLPGGGVPPIVPSGIYNPLPDEARGLCWGPFNPLITPFWCLYNGLTGWGVGLLISAVLVFGLPFNLVMSFPFLFMGRQWAWQNRRFTDITEFRKIQRIWGWWSLGTFFFILVPTIVLIILATSEP